MSFRFSICHPTARINPSDPLWWFHSMKAFYDACDRPQDVEYILVVHESNYPAFEKAGGCWASALSYATAEKGSWGFFRVAMNSGANTSNAQGNCAASQATGQILHGSMDDLFPPQHWDTLISDALIEDANRKSLAFVLQRVLHVSSGSPSDNDLFIPEIQTKTRYDQFGYWHHPTYESMFGDNEWTECAKRDGVVIEARHIVYEHRHPAFGTAKMDTVYQRENRAEAYVNGERNFDRRKALGFPVKDSGTSPSEVQGRKVLAICAPGETFSKTWVRASWQLLGWLCNQFLIDPYLHYTSNPYTTRQAITDKILESPVPKPDYVLWIDHDNLLCHEHFDILLKDLEAFNLDIVAGWCYCPELEDHSVPPKISAGFGPFEMESAIVSRSLTDDEIRDALKNRQILEVGWTGFPVVLMRYSALEKAGPLCFRPFLDTRMKFGMCGEDFAFSKNAREKGGLKIYVDPRVRVPHLKLGDAGTIYEGMKVELKNAQPATKLKRIGEALKELGRAVLV